MRSYLTLLALLPAVFSAPLEQRGLLDGQWIVKLRDNAEESVLNSVISSATESLGVAPRHVYNFGSFRGFAIDGVGSLVQALSSLADVESIEQDSVVTTQALTTQSNPPYGLARISHRQKGANNYVYDDSAGSASFAYIIDTGIYAAHNDFGGRATLARNFAGDGIDNDGNGHGTHVAGTTGSTTYGVAKKVTLIGVKVLDSDGSGSNANVIAGIQWAAQDMVAKGRKGRSVGNLSLGGLFSPSTNAAVRAAVEEGLFLAVAAGNSGLPTFTSSPASEGTVCTVGATDSNDQLASFSNFGRLVDILAPGVNVTSTWIDGPDDTNTISGTSMATPHIAGLGAYLLTLEGDRTPSQLCARIKELSTKGAISNGLLPSLFGTPNELAYNGNGA